MSVIADYWRAVYGNVLADPLCALIAFAIAWPFRHKIGAKLAAWWAKHHREHAVQQHLEALTRYAAGEDSRPPVPRRSQ